MRKRASRKIFRLFLPANFSMSVLLLTNHTVQSLSFNLELICTFGFFEKLKMRRVQFQLFEKFTRAI